MLLATADGDAANEGAFVQFPAGTSRLTVRAFVPTRSAMDCAEYALLVGPGAASGCAASADALEPNDSPNDPAELTLGSFPGQSVSGADPDYFTIELPPHTKTRLRLNSPSGNVRALKILDRNLGVRATNTFWNSSDQPIRADFEVALNSGEELTACADYDLSTELDGVSSGQPICSGVPNSTGQAAALTAQVDTIFGSVLAGLSLRTEGLPVGSSGFFLASPAAPQIVVQPGGSQGNLSLGSPVGRVLDSTQAANAFGDAWTTLDPYAIPQPNGTTPIFPGTSWSFQYWYRDANPLPTSNFSNAVQISF